MFKKALDDITPNMVLDQDLFADSKCSIPLLRKGSRISAKYIYKLKERGIAELYVKEQGESVTDGVEIPFMGSLNKINPYAKMSLPVAKARLTVAPKVKDESIKIMKKLHINMSGKDANEIVSIVVQVDRLINQLIGDIMSVGDCVNISNLRDRGEFVYHHSLGVTVLSLAMAHYMGFSPNELFALGKCAMLHDIGKHLIPADILLKSSVLDADELETVKKHAIIGYKYLKALEIGDDTLLYGVMFHHEREDGTGYYGVKKENIPLWSKIISVADTYDAMTSQRPYRPAISPSEVCEYILYNADIAFDGKVVDALAKKVDFYPVGSFVELSNGDMAAVINTKNKLRPVVQILAGGMFVDLFTDKRYLNIVIARAVPYAEVLSLNF